MLVDRIFLLSTAARVGTKCSFRFSSDVVCMEYHIEGDDFAFKCP